MMKESVCSCEKCKQMCAHSVCIPTPEEARELMRRGYVNRMSQYTFMDGESYLAPSPAGLEGAHLSHTNMGACTFFKDGLCELHDKGLKPLEGRLANHDLQWQPIRFHVISQWRGKAFQSVSAMRERVLNGNLQ